MYRALVGEPGLTYRYFDLRLFAFPWTTEGAEECTEAHRAMYRLGALLKNECGRLLKARFDQVMICPPPKPSLRNVLGF